MGKIVIDLDGVVYPMQEELVRYMNEEYNYPDFSLSRILTYDFNKSLDFGLCTPEWLNPMLKRRELAGVLPPTFGLGALRRDVVAALGNPELYRNLKPYEGVVETIAELCNLGDVWFYSLAFNREVEAAKLACVAENFKSLPITVDIVVGDTKTPLRDVDYVVEDCTANLRPYIKESKGLYLIDKPWNQPRYNPSLKDVFSKCVRDVSTASALNEIKERIQNGR